MDVHNKAAINKHGFTLIELLIVLLIISIVMSIALMTLHFDKRRKIKQEAETIVDFIQLAQFYAKIMPTILAVKIEQRQLIFYEYQNVAGKFFFKKNTTFLKPVPLSNDFIFSLTFAENSLVKKWPFILILPSNEVTPFVLSISLKKNTPLWEIMVNAKGVIKSAAISKE